MHDYYQEKVDTFTRDLEKQREMALHSPIGMAFVTFKSVNDSKQVFEDHESSVFRRCNSSLPLSSLRFDLILSLTYILYMVLFTVVYFCSF